MRLKVCGLGLRLLVAGLGSNDLQHPGFVEFQGYLAEQRRAEPFGLGCMLSGFGFGLSNDLAMEQKQTFPLF